LSTDNPDLTAALAVTRFGLGARPGEIAKARPNPKAWLKSQITAPAAPQPDGKLEDSATRFIAYRQYRQTGKNLKLAAGNGTPQELMNRQQVIGAGDELLARAQLASKTDAPFAERWVMFWANHFTVSAVKGVTAPLVGPFEREVIRKHAFDRFEALLVASSSHPAMLLYLDQSQSVGPDSPGLTRTAFRGGLQPGKRSAGLNENLAREIMELHTVGVNGGYGQADVTEFAKALTGWSVGGPRDAASYEGRFAYHAIAHEPGSRIIMGKRYADVGGPQALNILHDLAYHPATAQHIARKLAVHFVSDDPPPALVNKLATAFSSSGGNLAVVAAALVDADEAWAPHQAKFKTPYEFLISSWRAMDGAPAMPQLMSNPLKAMGQPAFQAPSPKGWDDTAGAWATPSNIVQRLTWSQGFAAQAAAARTGQPLLAAQTCLGALLTPQTAAAIAAAESRPEALTLLFMSPEFQRR
jgi:uncharacterized protein (DUF1800 family)